MLIAGRSRVTVQLTAGHRRASAFLRFLLSHFLYLTSKFQNWSTIWYPSSFIFPCSLQFTGCCSLLSPSSLCFWLQQGGSKHIRVKMSNHIEPQSTLPSGGTLSRKKAGHLDAFPSDITNICFGLFILCIFTFFVWMCVYLHVCVRAYIYKIMCASGHT